jgi:hypothetical protein
MKFNKWTLGLAAVGLVSLTSVARADEKPSAVQTALSNTTISGYVSASANVGLTDNYYSSPAAAIPFQTGKANGFNLDVVKLSIAKPEDEGPWASGYQVDLLFGPDAVGYNTSVIANSTPDYAIKQAYVTLRTPVGNGIDWKVGVFDSPLGYEVFDSGSNPNYTRSYGYAIEPTELTGLSATYKINDAFSLNGGVADTSLAGINNRNSDDGLTGSTWHLAYFGDVTYTAPASLGFLAGSTAFAGILYGGTSTPGNGYTHGDMGGNQVNYYGGLTLNTPWTKLTGGLAFDYAQNFLGGYSAGNTPPNLGPVDESYRYDEMALGLYGTYKATDKLSFNARGEYVEADAFTGGDYHSSLNLIELTGTVEYDLWANVVSRLEVRWDQNLQGTGGPLGALQNSQYTGTAANYTTERSSVGLYANVIYKF